MNPLKTNVGIRDFRMNVTRYVNRRKKHTVITHRGNPLAVLIPYSKSKTTNSNDYVIWLKETYEEA